MCFNHPPGLLPPPWRRGCCPPNTRWAPGRDEPATPQSLAMVSLGWHLKAARSVGLYMALGRFMRVLFCGTHCPLWHPHTVRGPREALQAPVDVSVLLREARSARRCHPPASTEFSMSPESQQGNSNYAQGTRVQNKPKSPAGHKSLAKMRQCKN